MTSPQNAATAHQTLTQDEAKTLVHYLEEKHWEDFIAYLMPMAKQQGITERDLAARMCDTLRAQAGMPAYSQLIF